MTDDRNGEDNLSQAWQRRLDRDGASDAASDAAAPAGADAAEPEPASVTEPAAETEPTAVVPPVSIPPTQPVEAHWRDDWGDESPEETPQKKRKWPWVAAGVVLVAGLGYVGANAYLADHAAADTKVAGVDIGSMTRTEAENALATGLDAELTTPREITIASGSTTLDPASIDLAIDYDATLSPLYGFTLNPQRILAEFSGGENLDATVTANDDELGAVMNEAANAINSQPVNATLTITDGASVVTPDEAGHGIDVQSASQLVVDSWLTTTGPIQLPESTLEADVTQAELETFAAEKIDPILSGPATINVNTDLVELTPTELGSVLSVTADTDKPSVSVDQEKLTHVCHPKTKDILTQSKEARIEIVNHSQPTIHPSSDGQSIDYEALATSVLELGSNRTIDATVITEPAEFTTADAEKLGIKEVVAEITTPLTDDNVRTTNLVVGTSKVNNTLVKPGEQFNLGDELGPVDEAHGFVSSGVVANGFNSTAMGGGLSQLSTNMFNIGYRSGMTDVAHQPHSKYFSRYPMGIESTIWGDTIKMIWENNTPYGAVVEAWVADGEVHSRLWSTKYWDVEVWQGEPFNYTKPTTKTNTAADCVPSAAGADGFSVTVGRKVSRSGEVHEDSQYTWTYQPVDAVRCG